MQGNIRTLKPEHVDSYSPYKCAKEGKKWVGVQRISLAQENLGKTEVELCNEKQKDHKEKHKNKKYLDHQPPIRGNTVEVLKQLTLCSFHIG